MLAERHAEEWARRLEVLDGYCELLVHLTDPPVHDAVLPETGRYHLLGRASALRRSERLRSELRDLVSVWAREGQTLPAPAARSALLVCEARPRRSRARD